MWFLKHILHVSNRRKVIHGVDTSHSHPKSLKIEQAPVVELNIVAKYRHDHVENAHIHAAVA